MAKGILKLEKLVVHTRECFPVDWLERYDWDTVTEQELISIFEKIDEYVESAFVVIAKSILSGEYLIRTNIIDVLNELKDVLCHDTILDSSNIDKYRAQTYFKVASSLLGFNINRYKQFITKLENRYTVTSPRFLVNVFSIGNQKGENHPMAGYFDVLFDIVEFDYLLSGDKDSVRTLILHHSRINDLAGSPIDIELKRVLEILDQKSLFLLKKLLIEDANEFDYLIDFKLQHYSVSSCSTGFLSDFDKSFEFYRSNNYTEDNFVRTLYQKSLNGKLRVGQMALLMKFYKDFSGSTLIQIDNLLEGFDKKYDQLYKLHCSRGYDVYALHTLKNYMYNCRLSFKISRTNYSYDDLEKDMMEIINIQNVTGILNFYPYQKAIEYIIKLVEEGKELSKLTLAKYLSRLDFYLKKCEEAINWCEEQRFIPIQNVYNDSISKVDDFGVVLVPSTFCRPINYDKRRHILNGHKTHALFLRNELSLREEREEIEAIKQQIDKSHWKNIELLSIFTAIITFLFGTVSFMANGANTTITQQIFNIVAIGVVLLLFVSAIAVVTMQREKEHRDYWKHPRVIFLIATIVISAILLVYILKVAPLLLNISY